MKGHKRELPIIIGLTSTQALSRFTQNLLKSSLHSGRFRPVKSFSRPFNGPILAAKKTRWRAFRWDSASDTTASIRITINSYQLSKSQQVPSARCEARYSWWYFSFETKESILEHIQLSRKLNFHLACIFFLFHLHGFGYKTSPSSKTYNVY